MAPVPRRLIAFTVRGSALPSKVVKSTRNIAARMTDPRHRGRGGGPRTAISRLDVRRYETNPTTTAFIRLRFDEARSQESAAPIQQ
jgi:hypothetical protein